MTKSKKILSLALAIVMALSVLSLSAFAAKTTPTANISVSASKETEITNGEKITITVAATASEDYFVGPMSIPVTFDSTLFTADNVVASDLFGAGTTEVVTNTTEAGKVTVVITPDTNGTPVATNLNGSSVTLFTFELTAIADAGSCDVAVLADQKTTANPTGKLYIGSFDGADARTAELTTVGQTLVLDAAIVNVTIGSAMLPADLELTALGETNGIKIDTHKTFGGAYDGAVYGFPQLAANTFATKTYLTNNLQATNGGSLSFSKTIGTTGFGTGTLITVTNADTTESKKYIVIIFGDVDGNGMINTKDSSLTKSAIKDASKAPVNSVKRMAANCAGTAAAALNMINTADASAVKYFIKNKQFSATSTVITLANAHFKANTYYQ